MATGDLPASKSVMSNCNTVDLIYVLLLCCFCLSHCWGQCKSLQHVTPALECCLMCCTQNCIKLNLNSELNLNCHLKISGVERTFIKCCVVFWYHLLKKKKKQLSIIVIGIFVCPTKCWSMSSVTVLSIKCFVKAQKYSLCYDKE